MSESRSPYQVSMEVLEAVHVPREQLVEEVPAVEAVSVLKTDEERDRINAIRVGAGAV
jgi:hypothetical protein